MKVSIRALALTLGVFAAVASKLARTEPPNLLEALRDAQPPCKESVVLVVCPGSADASTMQPRSPADDPRQKIREEFRRDEQAQRYRIDYENQHPEQSVVWGKTQNDTTAQGLKRFAATVQDGVRPDCMTAYSYAGLLAAPFILHDLVTDTGCH